MELALSLFTLLIILFILAASKKDKDTRKCKEILEKYYLSIKNDSYEQRKLYRENYLSIDNKWFNNIRRELVKKYLESKGCNYNRIMKDRIFIRGIPRVHESINKLMIKERDRHKDFENFLSYKS